MPAISAFYVTPRQSRLRLGEFAPQAKQHVVARRRPFSRQEVTRLLNGGLSNNENVKSGSAWTQFSDP
jgi:hypothetical protein